MDEVHLTSYDIKEVVSGKEIWDKDNPDQEDTDPMNEDEDIPNRKLDKMADYSELSLEELLERMEKVREQQKLDMVAVVTGLEPVEFLLMDMEELLKMVFVLADKEEGRWLEK